MGYVSSFSVVFCLYRSCESPLPIPQHSRSIQPIIQIPLKFGENRLTQKLAKHKRQSFYI